MTSELYDSITGVYSRSLLNTRLQHEVQRAVRSNQPLSLLMLDVDFFKSINDAFGHSRGDQALAEVAARIKAQIRLSDEIFRYGGDEFVILLPQISKQQAILLAQRILERVSQVPLTGEPPLVLSVSIGIASYPDDGDTPQRLFELADHRHYQSKILGRARVVSEDIDLPNGQTSSNGAAQLVERDHVLSQLKQFANTLETAPRGILHVIGRKGSGHTRFLQEVRNIFRLRGYVSLWLSGRLALQSRVYGVVVEAFQNWENPPQVISTESVETYLADFIKQKNLNGLVLLLDDWQCLDEASLALINRLYNSNKLEHVALAYAGEERDSIAWTEAEKDGLFTIELLPLTETGVRVWVRKSIGQEPPDELIRLMTGLTGGLPAHLSSVIRWMASDEIRNLENQNYVTVIMHLQNEYEHILEGANLPPNNLPENLPPFLDREDEITRIKKLLKEERVVTITGMGGMGKTRLALQVAGEILDQYKDGIFFVPLDSISSPAFMIDAISQAMKFSLDPKLDPLTQFLSYLSSRNILLILDNFESVPDGANLLEQIIDQAPAVRILITARERLDLPGETILELGGLAFPTADLTDVEEYPAVRLFMLYARFPPDFEPDLVSIGRICRLLDGIPLVIELASTWVSTLSTEQIALSIEQNLSFLSSYDESGYHRSLMAIFDSVWELFSKNEMRVLMGLGIFRGGFSYQAAARITGASHFFLDALANKLLIYRRGVNRYALHATLSQYLLEKLRADPLLVSHIEAQHNLFYLGYLRESEIPLRRSVSGPLVNDLLADIENIRTAWNQMVTAGNFRSLESTLSAWMSLLGNRGWFREALDDLLELDSKVPEAAAGGVSDVELFGIRIKSYQGEFYYHIGNYEAGIRELQDALQQAKQKGYYREEAEIYHLLGNHYSAIGRHQDSKDMYQLGLAIAEKRRDLYLVYQFMNSLGVGAYKESDFEGAIPIVKRALRIARKLENRGNIAQSLNNLGNLYYVTGDCPRARKILSKALTYLPDVENQTLKGSILDTFGKVLTGCEDFAYASQIFSRGLNLARELEATPLIVEMLVSVAELFDHIDEKPLALTLVNLAAEHPAASVDVKARAARLREKLIAEAIGPADRKWRADQLPRVVKDVIQILDQKASAESG